MEKNNKTELITVSYLIGVTIYGAPIYCKHYIEFNGKR